MQRVDNSNTNTFFLQTEALFWPLENILQKKVSGIALNILETLVDYIASFFDAYNQREAYLSSKIFSIKTGTVDDRKELEITHPILKTRAKNKQKDENQGILSTTNGSQIQANQTSGELVFDANGLSNMLMTTLTSLKRAIDEKGIQDFKNIKIQLQINNAYYTAIIPDKENNVNYSVDDLVMLESKSEPLVNRIADEMAGVGDKLSIKWDFILVDDKGKHTFSFRFKKTAYFEMMNGALFGRPGYEFESPEWEETSKYLLF